MSAAADASSRSAWALLRRFWQFAAPHRVWILIGISVIPIVSGLAMWRPLLVKEAVDVQIPAGDVAGLRTVAWWFVAAVLIEFGAQALQVYALQRGGHATITDLRRAIFAHALRLPARYYDRHPIGSLLSRTTNDVQTLSETLSFGVFTILTDMAMIGTILVAMFVLNFELALISLSAAPVLILIVRYFAYVLRGLQLEIRKAQGVQTGYLAEQLTGIATVQLYGREAAARDTHAQLGRRYLRATTMANVFDALLFSVMDGMSAFCIALLIYFAAPDVSVGGDAITLGLLFAFVDYLQRIFVPIREFSNKLATIQRAVASLERIYELLDETPEARATVGAADPLANWNGAIEATNLSFAYSADGEDVVREASFSIAAGEVVAVVGRTGSGKSSLARILTRFYDGYRGQIRLKTASGDLELRDVLPDHLRRHVLMVNQDVFLFNDTVAYNVGLGDHTVADSGAAIDGALELVSAAGFLRERGGQQLVVGERGSDLSAGEAQLLAFARVALRRPQLLILDEATASIDSETEAVVQSAIERLVRGRSVLVIAHRLSTIRHAHKILVMDRGRLVEQGTHEELLARGGRYTELYRSGFADET
ncbi:MAG: ABC transporter ATP-binding protein [Myxococcales bacterium FL481]|nr:MAG: ABC transporter ATP-binding protein [Myxococcales bacterium FL481]